MITFHSLFLALMLISLHGEKRNALRTKNKNKNEQSKDTDFFLVVGLHSQLTYAQFSTIPQHKTEQLNLDLTQFLVMVTIPQKQHYQIIADPFSLSLSSQARLCLIIPSKHCRLKDRAVVKHAVTKTTTVFHTTLVQWEVLYQTAS